MLQSSLINRIENFCAKHTLLPSGQSIIVGLSGGPDSVFLLHVLHGLSQKYDLSLIAAHIDHQWRSDSSADAQWCQQLAQKLGIPFIAITLDQIPISLKANGSQEELGRKARRYFFEDLASTHGADAIALAHHADDQQETFFIRLLRGASLTGLTGMQPKDGLYIRPLLECYKQEIIMYLNEHKIEYLHDPTNNSDAYLRNKIRMQVLPQLHSVDARFAQNFQTTLHRLQETDQFLDHLAQNTFEDLAQFKYDRWQIVYEKLLALHPVMQYRVLLQWLCAEKVPFNPSQNFFDEIIRFLGNNSSKEHVMHPQWRVVKERKLAYINGSAYLRETNALP